MFSGIIDAMGTVREVTPAPAGCRLTLAAPGYWDDLSQGGSVAIDGVCLTLTTRHADEAGFDVVPETLRCTTLGSLRPGSRVNLQKSLRVGDRIDGHFVQGHVDGVAVITRIERVDGEARWWFRMIEGASDALIPKGAVAIDGISLTIASMAGGEFSVALIPTTLERTTLGGKPIGARVNIETDILVRALLYRFGALSSGDGDAPPNGAVRADTLPPPPAVKDARRDCLRS